MFIYKITNKINGKIYIGMTKNSVSKRWDEHVHKNSGAPLLKSAIKKYGHENFNVEQIDEVSSIKDFGSREIFWIQKLKSIRPNGYNIQPGGSGGRNEFSVLAHEIPIKCVETEEKYRSITEAATKLGLDISKISAVCAGKRDSTNNLSFEYVDSQKRIEAELKRSHRKDRNRVSKIRSKSGKIGAKSRFKKVKCLETGIIFESIAEAARAMNLWRPNIVKNLQGKHKTVQGYTFQLIS